jgi:hypothetical protein
MSKFLAELSKDELLSLLYNEYNAAMYDVCACVVCSKSNKYPALGYVCDDCQERLYP